MSTDYVFRESFWSSLRRWAAPFGLRRPLIGNVPSVPYDLSSYDGGAPAAQVSDDRGTQIGTVYRCINIISTVLGVMPMPLYERTSGEYGRRILRDHWAARLARQPNPIMDGHLLREVQTAHISGWGDSFNWVMRDGSGQPRELWPLFPERVRVERDGEFRCTYVYEPQNRSPFVIPSNEMLHIKGFGFDGFRGMSVMALARRSMNIAAAAQDEAQTFFNAAGRPLDGILKINRLLDDDLRAQYRKRYGDLGKGTPQERRLWILEDGMEYTSPSLREEDAQYLATRKFEVEEISRFFGVPLHLLNHVEKQTSWGNGLEQQNQGFLSYTMQAYITRVERGWSKLLSEDEADKMYYEHNVEALLRADSAGRADYYEKMVDNGIMRRDEARAKENLPEEGGAAAKLTVKSGTVLLESLLEKPTPTVPPVNPLVPPVNNPSQIPPEALDPNDRQADQ